jgi:hypothetical protein
MNGDGYDLYFGALKVGAVTETDSDFPNLWGDIVYETAFSEPQSGEMARLAKFVALNRESTRLADLEDEQDTTHEQEVVNAELEAYADYVESADWHLIEQGGRELPILCPIFRGPGEVVWRWGLGGG